MQDSGGCRDEVLIMETAEVESRTLETAEMRFWIMELQR